MKRKIIKQTIAKRPLLLLSLLIVLVFGAIALLATYKPSKVSASWFDNAWGFRQRIPISNSSGSDQTNYQVQVSIDTASLVTAGKLQSSCADIRFTDQGGKSLPYWIEPSTCNTSATLIWVKMPSIPSTGADLFYYYGNAVATAPGNTRTSDVFIRDMSSAAASWPLQDTTSTQSYAAVTNPSLATGRNMAVNGDLETGAVSPFTAGNGAALSTQTSNPHGGTYLLRVTYGGTANPQAQYNSLMTPGKTYRVQGYMRSDGNTTPTAFMNGNNGHSGTTSTAWQAFDFTEVAPSNGTGIIILRAGNSTTNQYADFDDLIVTQVNLPPSSGISTQLLTDGNMEATTAATTDIPAGAWSVINSATLTKETGTPHGGLRVLRIARNNVNSPQARQTILTVGQAYRIYGYTRSDGTALPQVVGGGTTGFTGTASTAWQAFDFDFVATATNISLNNTTTTGTQYVEFDDVTVILEPNLRSGEISQDGNMEVVDSPSSWTNTDVNHYWTSGNSATVSKQTGTPHGGAQVLRIARNGVDNPFASQNVLVFGKTYRITGFARSDGTATPYLHWVGGATYWTGTTSTSWQAFDVTVVPPNNSFAPGSVTNSGTAYVEYDDISVTEVDPLVGNMTANTATNKPTIGSAAGGHLTTAYSFNSANSQYLNIYSSDLNSVFNPSEGTLVAWAKVSGAGVWTDGVFRRVVILQADGNNQIALYKSTTNNLFTIRYTAGSTVSSVDVTTSSSSWMQVAITWSKSGNQVKAYLNGSQTGSTQTGLGTWVGNLASTASVIGANATSGTNSWSGLINDVKLYTRALSANEIGDMYSGSTDIASYTSPTSLSDELVRKFSTGVSVGSLAGEEAGPGPSLYWKLDEASGTSASDSSGSSNTGTLSGFDSPPSTSSGQQVMSACVVNKCLRFNGSNSKVTGSKIVNGVKTVSFWINPNISANQGVINLDGGTHKISLNGSGVLTATGFASPIYYVNGQAVTTPTITSGVWSFVEITTTTGFNTTSSFTVGTDGSTYFGGMLDDIKFYPYVRSVAQTKVDLVNRGSNLGTAAVLGSASQILPTGLVANWPLDDTDPTKSYAKVLNPATSTGRNVVLNGTFDSDTIWSKGTGWTIANGVAHADGTGGGQSITQNLPITVGKTYTITYTVSNYVSGIMKAFVGLSSATTNHSANGTFTQTVTSGSSITLYITSDVSSPFTGDIDNVIVTEVNIPPSSGNPTQLLTDGDMEAAGTAAWTTAAGTLSKQTTSPHGGLQVLRVARNAVNNPSAYQAILTTGTAYRAYGYARSDGNAQPRITSSTGTTNYFVGTTSTSWQPFDFSFVADGSNFPLFAITSTGNQYTEWDDVTVALDTNLRSGELTQDGNMDAADASLWNVISTATIAKQSVTRFDGTTGLVLRGTQSGAGNGRIGNNGNIIVPGKTYRTTGYVRTDGQAGTSAPRILDTNTILFTGTNSTTWQYFDVSFIAGTGLFELNLGSGTTGYSEFDNISVTEVDPLAGTFNSDSTFKPTIGAASAGHLSSAYSFNPTHHDATHGDYVNLYTVDLNSALSQGEGTALIWAKVSGAGVWTDNTLRVLMRLDANDANNFIALDKNSTNKLLFRYAAGGVTKSITETTALAPTGWFQIAMTWSKSANQVKAYINGTQLGTTQTGLGTWNANLNSATTLIGASANTGPNPWSGLINDAQVYNRALTPAEISELYNFAPGPIAYWKFDERTGLTAGDSSGYGVNGTLSCTGGGCVKPIWATGKIGGGLSFNGLNFATVSNPINLSSFTFSTWLQGSDSGYNTILRLLSGTYGWGPDARITTGVYRTRFDTATLANQIASGPSTNIKDGNWHFVTTTYDATSNTATAYVDGIAGTPVVISGNLPTTFTTNTIGTNDWSGVGWNGTLDDMKIYNYVRTASQIQRDYIAEQAVITANQGASPITPIAWWKFDEGFGTSTKNSATSSANVTGTLNSFSSPATATSGWQMSSNCKINNCLAFSSSGNNYINIPANPLNLKLTGDFSVSAWIKPNMSASSYTIAAKDSGTNGNRGWYLMIQSGNNLRLYTSTDGTSAGFFDTTAALPNNTWTHVVGVHSGSTLAIYFNGVLQAGTLTGSSASTIFDSNTDFTIGSRAAAGNPFNGLMDELKIYNAALTADQVKAEYNQGLSTNYGVGAATESTLLSDGAGNPPVAYWNFEERTGTTVNDKSGNNNTITLFGTPSWVIGKNGSAVNFAATGQYGTTPGVTIGSTWTINAWSKFPLAVTGSYRSLVRNGNGHHQVIVTSAGLLGVYVNSFISSGYNVGSLTGWHYLTAVGSGGSTVFYIDGQNVGTAAAQETGTIAEIGNITTGGQNWGLIDDLKVYNYVRTQAQIAYDYNRGLPVGWWKFDECQGTTLHDSSGNSLSGTWAGGTAAGTCNTAATAWGNGATGKFNSSINFDGTSDYVDLLNPTSLQISGSLTISGWGKMNAGSGGISAFLLSKFTSATRSYRLYAPAPAGQARCDIGLANRVTNLSSNYFTNGNWYHYACVYDATASTLHVYVNGQLADGTLTGSVPSSIPNITSNNVHIGSTSDNAQFAPGQIDDVRVYNYALSASQIKQVFNGGLGTFYGPSTGSP